MLNFPPRRRLVWAARTAGARLTRCKMTRVGVTRCLAKVAGAVPMQHFSDAAEPPRSGPGTPADHQVPGLFRRESIARGTTGMLTDIFANLRHLERDQPIAEHPERNLLGTRLLLERTQGDGTWELYRLDQDIYVVAADCVYDTPRIETAPGEGLLEFHLRLGGALEMWLPGQPAPILVIGPRLLIMYQPPGVDVTESVVPNARDSCVSLYCRPAFLAHLAKRSGMSSWPLLDQIERNEHRSVWYRQLELSPTLLYIGTSLLQAPYEGGLRLLHAEAKALELLCDVLANPPDHCARTKCVTSANDERRLDTARHMLATNLTPPWRIRGIARAIGMSESKLKRTFKSRFGMTVFEYGLECRMRHALELLRCRRMSVSQVAFAVGYRHQTSFASAFHDFHGFLPSKARTEMR
jgi:AraC-like DNA-binding protein